MAETAKKKKSAWGVIRVILIILLVLIIIVAGYLVYVFATYYRVEDNKKLDVRSASSIEAKTDTEYKIISYNTGFGAYEDDFSFFMDGGERSWAFSKERLVTNLENITNYLKAQDADIMLLQEVDEDATRTYHVNERNTYEQTFNDYDSIYAQNWDSPFLMYPITQPHGKTKTGIITMSRFGISEAVRRSVPIEDSVRKIVDLDRCYSKSVIPVEGDKKLVLYNLHLSAYTSDGSIADEQVKMLVEDMENEYQGGAYVIAGGDFNKDLLGDSSQFFGIQPAEDYSWCKPINMDVFEGKHLILECSANAPSTRIADAAYNPDQFVAEIDGFIVSDNIDVVSHDTLDTQFKYSDHNPITMKFVLKGEFAGKWVSEIEGTSLILDLRDDHTATFTIGEESSDEGSAYWSLKDGKLVLADSAEQDGETLEFEVVDNETLRISEDGIVIDFKKQK